MKDFTRSELESARPDRDLAECANFCLEALYSDSERNLKDSVVPGLTFEELIGTLLLARDLSAPLADEDALNAIFEN